MLSAAPAVYATNVAAFGPILDTLSSVLVTPQELAGHWSYTEEHLCNLRRAGRGPRHIKLETGGVRYRASEIIGAELRGTTGAFTFEAALFAIAACDAVPAGYRAAMQAHLRAAYPTG